jgi:hypothetical protein
VLLNVQYDICIKVTRLSPKMIKKKSHGFNKGVTNRGRKEIDMGGVNQIKIKCLA